MRRALACSRVAWIWLVGLGAFELLGCQGAASSDSTTGGAAGARSTGGSSNGGAAGSHNDGGASTWTVYDGVGTWAEDASSLGVFGGFFILEDGVSNGQAVEDGLVHTDLSADSFGDESAAPVSLFTEETPRPCVSGTLALVTLSDGSQCDPVHDECAWDSLWGGGLGMHLSQPDGPDTVAQPWDATAYGIEGFEFTTTGDIGRATLRFKAKDSVHPGEDFCAIVAMGADRHVPLSKLKHRCWGNEGALSLDVTKLTELQWQIVPDAETAHAVTRFCVSRLSAF
jgi:hypothetical protein